MMARVRDGTHRGTPPISHPVTKEHMPRRGRRQLAGCRGKALISAGRCVKGSLDQRFAFGMVVEAEIGGWKESWQEPGAYMPPGGISEEEAGAEQLIEFCAVTVRR